MAKIIIKVILSLGLVFAVKQCSSSTWGSYKTANAAMTYQFEKDGKGQLVFEKQNLNKELIYLIEPKDKHSGNLEFILSTRAYDCSYRKENKKLDLDCSYKIKDDTIKVPLKLIK